MPADLPVALSSQTTGSNCAAFDIDAQFPVNDLNLITADQMRAHGLPPLEISWRGAFFVTRFPEPDMPLSYSGPPGGPDSLRVQVVYQPPGSAPFSLDDEIRKHDQPGQKFVLGAVGEFDIGGQKRAVRCWSIKPTPWLDSLATAAIPVPMANAIVLVTFTAWRDADGRLTTHFAQRAILDSLAVVSRPI